MPKKKFSPSSINKSLLLKEDMQEYGLITKILGGRRFTCNCFDNTTRIAIVRSKKIRVDNDDIVLVSLRSFDNKTCDIIHKYDKTDIRSLQKQGEIPESISSTSSITSSSSSSTTDDCVFNFEDI